jgi:deazaflavin-dependent oxidoreductase (nitroreductase family)
MGRRLSRPRDGPRLSEVRSLTDRTIRLLSLVARCDSGRRVRNPPTNRVSLLALMARTPRLRHVDPHKRRGRPYRAVCRFSATRLGGWLSTNIAWKVDPHLLRLTRGRFSTAVPVAAALLETRGARTGQPRRNATLYFHDGDRVTIIASLRGWAQNPAWYYNLVENPEVVFGGLPFRAKVVKDEAERQRLWRLADRVYPPYADFREQALKAGRAIPIVQLVPR